MFRSFTARTDRAITGRAVDLSRVVDVIRAIGIAVVLVTVSAAQPHPGGPGARGVAIAVTLAAHDQGLVPALTALGKAKAAAAKGKLSAGDFAGFAHRTEARIFADVGRSGDIEIGAWNRALSGDGDSIDRGGLDKKIRSARQKLPKR